MANTELTGGCLCGRIRYTITGEPVFSGLCHCRSCQRYTGSAFETVIAFPAEAVRITGALKTFHDTGDSGQPVHRSFCPDCGSGIIAQCDVLPGLTIVLAGGLDDPAVFKPTMDVYWSRVQPWFHSGGGGRKQFPLMPE
ncbi:MAG TPA: GFA family protein [Acetobacteraceae bacterium]|nr:GFA family protein [Acetobacteraceae bacterium]